VLLIYHFEMFFSKILGTHKLNDVSIYLRITSWFSLINSQLEHFGIWWAI